MAKKVPDVTGSFWAIKILTTAMGEALSDYLVATINPALAVLLGTAVFAVALIIQFKARRFAPWKYWLCVSLVAVVGTMFADVVHIGLGVPYVVSTIVFAAVLALVFAVWRRTEGTLSIHSVRTVRRESFYWATVMVTFALGTAAGDLTAATLHLGYLLSGILFLALILVPALVYLNTRRSEVLWFWAAYILTRPLGASFADWIGKSKAVGGLSVGEGVVSIVLIAAIVIVVALTSGRARTAPVDQK